MFPDEVLADELLPRERVLVTASVTRILDQPARYGWPYDAAVVVGFGYGRADLGVVADALDRPEVERWGAPRWAP